MRDEFLVFGSPLIEEAEIAEVVDSLRSGWIGTGPKVQRFERMLEQYIGVRHVRCLHSCTAALTLGMMTLEVGPGDEVIVPTMTFPASANAILHVGATPVFVDSVPGTGLMDLAATEAAINERTRAIMAVHMAGRPVDIDRLNALRDSYSIAIVEDAAHALGTEWRGRRIGSHGNLAAFSFYATKNVTTGEGGALATEDEEIAAKIERLSLHGLSAGAWQRYSDQGFRHYEVTEPGYKFNMMDIQAALGIHQLPRLDAWIDYRAKLWDRYNTLLAELPVATPPDPDAQTRHARHLYQVLLERDAAMSRDELLDFLTRQRIGVGVHYRAVHLHAYYRQQFGITPDQLPVASDISERTLSLPLSPKLSEADQDDVVEALTLALGQRRVPVSATQAAEPVTVTT
jgi:dTDP-4-amino-4,6-dideoxygalactose transaminase